MALYLKAEKATEVEGIDECIRITQYEDGNEQVIWLSPHQLSIICNNEKELVRQAFLPK